MKSLSVLLVGAGHLGKIHLKLLHEHAQEEVGCAIRCVGIVDPCVDTRVALAAQWNLPTFANVEACQLPFDAAVVATPTKTHFETARQLLLRRKHLLIEKPLTFTPRESQQLVDLAKQQRCVVQVGHVERFNPAYQTAYKQIQNPRYAELHRGGRFTGRSTDVGVVMDLMIHDIDLMLNMIDADIQRVEAMGVSVFGDHEDMAQARVTFTNGAVVNLWASRCSYTAERSLKLMGTNGFVQADLTTRQITTVTVPEDIQAKRVLFNRLSPEAKQKLTAELFDSVLPKHEQEIAGCNPLLNEQADFFQAIVTGRPNQVPASDGHRAVMVANQILSAIRAHAWSEDTYGPRGPLVSIDQFASPAHHLRVA